MGYLLGEWWIFGYADKEIVYYKKELIRICIYLVPIDRIYLTGSFCYVALFQISAEIIQADIGIFCFIVLSS